MKFSEDQARLITRIYKDNTCPVCKSRFKNNYQLCQHIYNRHKEEDAIANKYRNIRDSYNKDFIECPYCGRKLQDLSRHLLVIHNVDTKDFRLNNPITPLKVVKVKYSNYTCGVCDKHFKTLNGLSSHYRIKHPEYYDKIKHVNTKIHYTCPICNKQFNDIRQHVSYKHSLTWEDFCRDYNWSTKDSKYINDLYRKHLSENKRSFYKSDRGILWRKKQSDYFSKNNPGKLYHVRNKISKLAINHINDNKFFNNSWGIRISDSVITKGKFVRSFEEFKILYTLYKNNIEFEYEPESFEYYDGDVVKNYLPDLKIGDDYYEIKCTTRNIPYSVLHKCSSIGKSVQIVTSKDLFNKFNILCDMNDLYVYCSKQLDHDNMKIIFRTYKSTSRILERICKNFRNHRNIDFRSLGVDNEICKN